MPIVDGERDRAFDLRDSGFDAHDVAAAIAVDSIVASDIGSASDIDADSTGDADPSPAIEICCPDPGPVHERVGVVDPGRSYPLQAALAAAARRLGHEPSQAPVLADVRDRLAALELPSMSLAAERRRVAEIDDATALEEQVATLRGQLEAARERGDGLENLAEARKRAVADLTERRTERLAAEQSLDRARTSAREVRDRREERLRLEDRERNLERAARRELARELQPSFERALTALPGGAAPGANGDGPPGSVDGPDALGALAVCRVAPMPTPVVVAGEWFSTATAAAAALDAPVILVEE